MTSAIRSMNFCESEFLKRDKKWKKKEEYLV